MNTRLDVNCRVAVLAYACIGYLDKLNVVHIVLIVGITRIEVDAVELVER